MTMQRITHHGLLAVLLASVMTVAGCASTGPEKSEVNDSMAQAKKSITRAEQAGARDHASVALSNAETKLDKAREMMKEGKLQKAYFLVDEVSVDAQHAAAKAKADKVREAKQQLDESNQALQNKLQENASNQ